MTFGLTPEGFRRKRLNDIIAELEAEYREVFGQEITTDPLSVFGQLIGIWAEREALLWEQMEAVYLSAYPRSAEGINLDNSLEYTGVHRQPATATTVYAVLFGDEGTVVPAGAQVALSNGAHTFNLADQVTISMGNVRRITVKVSLLDVETTYGMVIDGVGVGYTSGLEPPTAATVLQALADAIHEENAVRAEAQVVGDELVITAVDAMGVSDLTNLSVVEFGSLGYFVAQEPGPIHVPTGTLTNRLTTVTGWNRVQNYTPGIPGRNEETDDEARLRRRQSLRIIGAAAVPAIAARLRDVQGVSGASIIENRHWEPDADGRPPHSFEAVVSGGRDEDIARVLWESKPSGIEPVGNVTAVVEDSQGEKQVVRFSRAKPIYLWVNVVLKLHDEERFPVDGTAQVKEAIVNYGRTLDVGEDVIRQRFHGPIHSVPGVAEAILSFATSETPEGPPGLYTSDNLSIHGVEKSEFDTTRITVTVDFDD